MIMLLSSAGHNISDGSFRSGTVGMECCLVLVAYLVGWYLLTKNRKSHDSHITKGSCLAHLMPFPFVDSELRMPIALKVKVKKATLLAPALEEGGFADPYVAVTLKVPNHEPDKRKTSPKYQTKNPVWDEKF
jgi:hypothetical protein